MGPPLKDANTAFHYSSPDNSEPGTGVVTGTTALDEKKLLTKADQ